MALCNFRTPDYGSKDSVVNEYGPFSLPMSMHVVMNVHVSVPVPVQHVASVFLLLLLF